MKDNLASRVGRIISGSLNALIDTVENAVPETVMAEAIREVEGAIDEVRAELGKVVANKYLVNTRLMEENRKHEQLSASIELSLKEGREDLAEVAISNQLDIEVQIPVLEAALNEGSSQEKELEGYISALLGRKREMITELNQFKQVRLEEEAIGAGGVDAVTPTGNAESRVSKAESVFNRVMESSTGLESGRVTADRKTASQLAELEDMVRKNRIQERLMAFKEGK
ncbi:MAG: PspA/IM30 family protein [Sedimenticola sp.]|nr:PspA/IM30 family protein [Sedimenticola sp.]